MPNTRIAIIGAGLAGLYAAYRLHRKGIEFDLFEARDRVGGRILSTNSGGLDLGPTWFWPDFQPRLHALAQELGLPVFEQHEAGDMLLERARGGIVRHAAYRSGNQSMRFEGSTARLIQALLIHLPGERLHLNAQVTAASQRDSGVSIELSDGQSGTARYSQLWLAIPPRLAARIAFTPTLSERCSERLATVPTWMAGHAKYMARFPHAFWREQGLSGGALSSVGPLGEIHDASNSATAALFGFFAIGALQRKALGDTALRSLCRHQLARLFGTDAGEPLEDWIQDWATEAFTATPRDQICPRSHDTYDLNKCIDGSWATHMVLIGSEASGEQAGYMEGALLAADLALRHTHQQSLQRDSLA